MKTIIENGTIKVQSEYNKDFISGARTIQGKWNSPYWVFPEENKDKLCELLTDVYGECGDLADDAAITVTVDLDLDRYDYGDDIRIGNFTAVRRISRDRDVVFADNVMLISGGFPSSGGSAKNPCVYPDKSTTIRIKNLPMQLYDKIKDMDGVSIVSAPDKSALIEERNRLLKRISELNALIGDAV